LGLRSRFALDRLADLNKQGPLAIKDLQHMVMDDQVYLASQVMPDLLRFCAADLGSDAETLKSACVSLKAWDGRANLDAGLGLVHFQNIM
ncbi:penicillin acylase family protein, partial [Stenotrophomonas maltophilia]